MNDSANNRQTVIDVPLSRQENSERHDKGVSTVSNPRTMSVGDTTVRLSFNDSGDLNTRLANAFQTMLDS